MLIEFSPARDEIARLNTELDAAHETIADQDLTIQELRDQVRALEVAVNQAASDRSYVPDALEG